MFVSAPYLKKLLNMRDQGFGEHIKSIVLFDTDQESLALKERALNDYQINVYTLEEVREAGKSSAVALQPELVARDDIYMLNYTSGTTGDSKGVKVSQWGILSSAFIFFEDCGWTSEDVIIDYLPAPHVFDQFMFFACIIAGASQGYYQGNPLKLMDDCAILKPTLFPSVPRLYNKIFARINQRFGEATGCKKWLLDKGMASKTHYLT